MHKDTFITKLMKIELKNTIYNVALSEETIMFKADIYVDGVRTAHVRNYGTGGCNCIHEYTGMRERLEAAEQFCLALPPVDYMGYSIDMNLDLYVDELLHKYIHNK